jgi:hypothetical protein
MFVCAAGEMETNELPLSMRRFLIACNLERRLIMLFAGALAFSITMVISALITQRHNKMDGTEIATYLAIIVGGSLFWSLFLSKCAI